MILKFNSTPRSSMAERLLFYDACQTQTLRRLLHEKLYKQFQLVEEVAGSNPVEGTFAAMM